jgi:hypothetical protein
VFVDIEAGASSSSDDEEEEEEESIWEFIGSSLRRL